MPLFDQRLYCYGCRAKCIGEDPCAKGADIINCASCSRLTDEEWKHLQATYAIRSEKRASKTHIQTNEPPFSRRYPPDMLSLNEPEMTEFSGPVDESLLDTNEEGTEAVKEFRSPTGVNKQTRLTVSPGGYPHTDNQPPTDNQIPFLQQKRYLPNLILLHLNSRQLHREHLPLLLYLKLQEHKCSRVTWSNTIMLSWSACKNKKTAHGRYFHTTSPWAAVFSSSIYGRNVSKGSSPHPLQPWTWASTHMHLLAGGTGTH